MDRLVGEGVSFDNCFITAASCAPARASLFTGYYPHTTGIYKNADSWKVMDRTIRRGRIPLR